MFIDKKLKPWLLEVNLAPSFNTDTPLDEKLKTGVIHDTFKLLGLSHNERVRKMNRKREEMQRRIV